MSSTELTEKLAAQGARLIEYRGGQTAAVYSDPRREFSALRSACGLYDLGWRTNIALGGRDRVRWLNGMITNNIRDLAVGRGVYGFLLNPQGRILGDLYAYDRGDYLLVATEQAQAEKVLGIFKRYIIMDQVEVTNISEKLTAIGVSGPSSREMLRAAGLELPILEPLQLADITWQQVGLTVVRGDNPVAESYEVFLPPESVNRLWDALVKAGATPVGCEGFEMFRIAAGIPRYGQDIRERDLPQETEQTRALNFTKGCYIGQEIVERIRSRGNVHRKFTGFVLLQGGLPVSGTKVQADGKEIGEITSVASLPVNDGDLPVALGYVRREIGIPGKEVQMGNTQARVSELPFAEVFRN
jgi:folate-binding protein YgfZ